MRKRTNQLGTDMQGGSYTKWLDQSLEQVKSMAAPRQDTAPKLTSPKPSQPTPSQINRQDAAMIQSGVTRPSIDQQRRDHFAQTHPEYTGGMEGARTRQANTAVVQAQAQVDKAQTKVDQAQQKWNEVKLETPSAPASSYLTGAPATTTTPYAAAKQYDPAQAKAGALYGALRQTKGALKEAQQSLADAQTQKADLDRERELLADVSTPQWDQLIRDKYADTDINGVVSEEEVRSQKIKVKKGIVQVERDKAQAEMGAAQDIMFAEQDAAGDFWDPTRPTKRYAAAWRDYQAAKARVDELGGELDELANLDYPARNESGFGMLAADEEAGKQYASAAKVKEDQQKLYEVIGYYQKGQGGSPEERERISEMREELLMDYGLSEASIAAYVGGYEPYSGEASVQQVMERMDVLLSTQKKPLAQTEGRKAGYDFEDLYGGYQQRLQRQEEAAQRAQWAAQTARDNPLGSTAATVFLSPFQAFDAARIDWGTGKPGDVGYIPPDSSNAQLINASQTIRETHAHDLTRDTDWELFGQNVPAFLYNTGMSMADSALAVSVLGPGSVYLMGTNAAVSTAKEVVDNGGTTDQALKLGIVAGIVEVLFEQVPVEHLLKERTVSDWREMLTLHLTKRGIKCSEEMLTEGANILAEMAVLGRSSDYAKAVDRYRHDGKSESQAKQQAFLDMLSRVGGAGMGGGLWP